MESVSRRRLLAALGSSVALAGCSEREVDDVTTSPPTASTTETPAPYTPTLHGDRPDEPTEEVGIGAVAMPTTNRRVPPENDRTLRMPADGTPWERPVLQGSGTFSHTLDAPGVYDAFGLHENSGQVATVLVGRPDPDEQPALIADDEMLPATAREQLSLHHDVVRELLA
ncbi:MAG: hypothetical protein ACI8UR_001653 [Natronomonas sp.]|jgi:hypothetical protein|uniref:cupredoxin domain-containing protein n=1 Tax=Natronomonas sp. TaxID=2184060 RepID=UPI003988F7CB